MAVNRKNPKSRVPKDVAFEDMTPSAKVAHEIVSTYVDLTPSVHKIMSADLSEAQKLRAITSFQESLGPTDSPFRDPNYAVANCGPAD